MPTSLIDIIKLDQPEEKRLELVKAALDGGAEVNETGWDEKTALLMAAEEGLTKISKLLIDKGADVHCKTTINSTTILHAAIQGGNKEIFDLLIDQGADINAQTNFGNSVLHDAALHGDTETCKVLLANGADINATNRNGETPLRRARSSIENIILLVDFKGLEEGDADAKNS